MVRLFIFLLLSSLALKQVSPGLRLMPDFAAGDCCSPCDEGEKEKEDKTGEKGNYEDKLHLTSNDTDTFISIIKSRIPIIAQRSYLSFFDPPSTPPPNLF
ncbi:MAG: hypothetical protein EOO04_18845 [Chitinophagaceae bacterium]|nr:MAG: hypothetical protein EOO04_18845 [Chitinophagaceae bacterium]